jgi:hypothetical protein
MRGGQRIDLGGEPLKAKIDPQELLIRFKKTLCLGIIFRRGG